MNIFGIGTDIVSVDRIKNSLKNKQFIGRIFNEKEILKCKKNNNSVNCYAKRFAAKEATSKALGTGISNGISWQQIEIENLSSGKPKINLFGNAKKKLETLLPKNMTSNILITITDEKDYAQALVIIEAKKIKD